MADKPEESQVPIHLQDILSSVSCVCEGKPTLKKVLCQASEQHVVLHAPSIAKHQV